MANSKYLIVAALCLVSSGSAFQSPALPQQQRASSMPQIFLHPDQAADLEACAYDLTKDFLEEKSRQTEAVAFQTPVDPNTMTAVLGPVAWCRRRLWPFGGNKVNETLRP